MRNDEDDSLTFQTKIVGQWVRIEVIAARSKRRYSKYNTSRFAAKGLRGNLAEDVERALLRPTFYVTAMKLT